MKNLKILIVILLTGLTFSSCLDLGNDEDYTQYIISMATVSTGGANPEFQTDEGYYLVPQVSVPADTFSVGERYFLYYSMADTTDHALNTYPINLSSYSKVIIKNFQVLEIDSTDQWYDQPLPDFTWAWYSGQYFNTVFSTFVGTSTPNTYELVRIMENENNVSTDTVPELYFELRHNVSSYTSVGVYYHYVSFDLSSLPVEFPKATKFEINITWNSYYYGELSFSDDYIPNQGALTYSSEIPARKVMIPRVPIR
jgi:hypothetical protein